MLRAELDSATNRSRFVRGALRLDTPVQGTDPNIVNSSTTLSRTRSMLGHLRIRDIIPRFYS
jgi:hypothetical protein